MPPRAPNGAELQRKISGARDLRLGVAHMVPSVTTDHFAGKTWTAFAQELDDSRTNAEVKTYINRLLSAGLPVIIDPEHFSRLVGYDLNFLYSITNSQGKFYRFFSLDKATGGKRRISEPLPTLKEIQRWILDNLITRVLPHPCCKSYRKNYSVKSAARFHSRSNTVLKVDVKKFYRNVTEKSVQNLFYKLGYTRPLSVLISKLCCLHGSLPEGSPTSPAISNLILRDFDEQVFRHAIEKKMRYTRYADDLTISGNLNKEDVKRTIEFVAAELGKAGLKINRKKTKVFGKGSKKVVLGIVVNNGMRIERDKRRKIRQEVYYLSKFGLDGHVGRIGTKESNYADNIIGRIRFGLFVNSDDIELKREESNLKKALKIPERQTRIKSGDKKT